jgi:putative acetyltransferase
MESTANIRRAGEKDYDEIRELTFRAFDNEGEPDLVEAIRESEYYIPELSLVAVNKGRVEGHILFSMIRIITEEGEIPVLTLAPMSVDPGLQKTGIGSRLVETGLRECRRLGHKAVIVIGHPEFYAKFGFRPARGFGLEVPFDVPGEAFMAIELETGALRNAAGMVEFSPPFDGLV